MANAVSAGRADQLADVFRVGQDRDADGSEALRRNIAAFAAVSGGWSRYTTGSHVDMTTQALVAGAAWGGDLTPGYLTLGAFIEHGRGDYDSYMDLLEPPAASIHGEGETHHVGGGLLTRLDHSGLGPGNAYAEASFRIGRAHNRYRNDDITDVNGIAAAYSSSSLYYGGHLGAGYIWDIGRKVQLDFSGKAFLTRYQGESVVLTTGENVEFEDIGSLRFRLGGRVLFAPWSRVSVYTGASGEYEADGEARAAVEGFPMDTPTLSGFTGTGELGILYTPASGSGFFGDLGVQGHIGKRKGLAGNMRLGWVY